MTNRTFPEARLSLWNVFDVKVLYMFVIYLQNMAKPEVLQNGKILGFIIYNDM